MSHVATRWAMKQRGLKPAAKMVLFYLCYHHNEEHGCFPSQETLAEECEISRSSLNNQLNALENAGFIKRHSMIDDRTKRQRPTRYILAFEAEFNVQNLDNPVSKDCTRSVSKNDVAPCPEFGQPRVQNLDTKTVRYNPVSEAAARAPADSAPSRRERILEAMGVDGSGITPSGKFIGTPAHMAEPPKWDALGLTEDDQLSVIRSQMERGRCRDPNFMPGSLAYFTGAMSDLAAAKARGVPPLKPLPQQSERDQHKARLRKLAGR